MSKTKVTLDGFNNVFPDNNSPFPSAGKTKLVISEMDLNQVPITIHLISTNITDYTVITLEDSGTAIVEYNLLPNTVGVFYRVISETENKATFSFELN